MSALQGLALMPGKQPSPLSIRLESDLETKLEELTKGIGEKRHAIAAAALRLGIEALESDKKRFYDAQIAAEKAKAEAKIQELTEQKRETKTKPTSPRKASSKSAKKSS